MSHSINKEATALLTRARGYVAEGWTQYSYFRRADGTPCHLDGTIIREQCLVGSLLHAYATTRNREATIQLSEVRRMALEIPSLVRILALLAEEMEDTDEIDDAMRASEWNDAPERTQREVLALMDRALARITASEGA